MPQALEALAARRRQVDELHTMVFLGMVVKIVGPAVDGNVNTMMGDEPRRYFLDQVAETTVARGDTAIANHGHAQGARHRPYGGARGSGRDAAAVASGLP